MKCEQPPSKAISASYGSTRCDALGGGAMRATTRPRSVTSMDSPASTWRMMRLRLFLSSRMPIDFMSAIYDFDLLASSDRRNAEEIAGLHRRIHELEAEMRRRFFEVERRLPVEKKPESFAENVWSSEYRLDRWMLFYFVTQVLALYLLFS